MKVFETGHRSLSYQKGIKKRAEDVFSWVISVYLCTFVVIGFVVSSDDFWHWFVLPVLCCGILISKEAVDWIRGRLNIFDPVGIIGLLGFHFFFLAPLLHVYLDYWLEYVVLPPDMRGWLGKMAMINVIGLLLYRISKKSGEPQPRTKLSQEKTIWTIDRKRFLIFMPLALLTVMMLQIVVYQKFGGLLGYIQAYDSQSDQTLPFRNHGWLFTMSESFPILAMMTFAILKQKKTSYPSWFSLFLILGVYLILQMLFGGLRGSRSNTIWGLFWAVGIIHFWIRPVSKKVVLTGLIFLVVFMYFYGFYKGAGLDALKAFEGSESRKKLEEKTDRTFNKVILGDLARSDVQAFMLYRLLSPESDYEYALGRTYFGDMAILVPRFIWPDRPPAKVKEGTEIMSGRAYIPGVRDASNVYGLAGEAMLNFGPFVVPFMYLLFGFFIRTMRTFFYALDYADSRLFLVPFFVNLCFVILAGDLDNIIFFLVKNGAVPIFVIMLVSTRKLVKEDNSVFTSPPDALSAGLERLNILTPAGGEIGRGEIRPLSQERYSLF